jgi:hypothetical protein
MIVASRGTHTGPRTPLSQPGLRPFGWGVQEGENRMRRWNTYGVFDTCIDVHAAAVVSVGDDLGHWVGRGGARERLERGC